MSAIELALALARSLDVLGAGHRDAAPRHRSLRDAFAPSWEMLSACERSAIAQASAFSSSFTLKEAEHVIDLSFVPAAPSCVEVLHALVDHSMIGRVRAHGGSERAFRVHEAVRSLAVRELADDAKAAVERHDRYFVRRAEAHDGEDLLVAVERMLESPTAPTTALALLPATLAASAVLERRGEAPRRLAMLDAVLSHSWLTGPEAVQASLRIARAEALLAAGRAVEAHEDLVRAEEIARTLGDAPLRAALARTLGKVALDEGRLDEGIELAVEALASERALGARQAEALLLVALARRHAGDLEAAKRCAESALSIDDGAHATLELGRIAHEASDFVGAERLFASTRVSGASDPALVRALDVAFARLLLERAASGDATVLAEARATLERSAAAHRAAGATSDGAEAVGLLGLCCELEGQRATARARYEEAASVLCVARRSPLEGLFLAFLGRLEAGSDRLAEAEHALDAARSRLFATGARSLACVCDLCEGHVAIAEARAARARGDGAADVVHTQRASRVLSATVGPSVYARIARHMLSRELGPDVAPTGALPGASRSGALVISASALWFSASEGPCVRLDTRRALRLILQSLVEQRERSPGTPLDVASLLEAGWPRERVLPEAGTSRVYTAVSQLRREGLRDVLLRRDDGYLLDPAIAVRRVPD
jgi:tetratricopeptide (TPR) repeat protein